VLRTIRSIRDHLAAIRRIAETMRMGSLGVCYECLAARARGEEGELYRAEVWAPSTTAGGVVAVCVAHFGRAVQARRGSGAWATPPGPR